MRATAIVGLILLFAAAPAVAAVGPQATEVVLLKFADHPNEEPCTAAFAADVVYREYGDWLLAESRGREWVTGSDVWGWLTLPHELAHYRCPIGSAGPAISSCSADLYSDAAAATRPYFDWRTKQLVVFVYNVGVGAATGSPFVHTTCGAPAGYAQLNLPVLKHEGGHAQAERLFHSGGLSCPGADVGPSLEDLLAGGCWWGTYSDRFDPMGSGVNDGHYSTYMRGRLDWLEPSNIQTVNATAIVEIQRADIDSPLVQETRVHLGWAAGFPTYEYFYTLEYRPAVGVLVRLRGCAMCPGTEAFVVNGGQPITTSDRFIDPYRGVTISLLSEDGETATLQVTYTEAAPAPGPGHGKAHRRAMVGG